MLKIFFFTKQATLNRKSTVLSLSLQLVFLAWDIIIPSTSIKNAILGLKNTHIIALSTTLKN